MPIEQCDERFYKKYRTQLLPAKPRLTVPTVPSVNVSQKQKLVVHLVDNHLKGMDNQKNEQLQVLALGCAGAGKSAALLWVKKLLEEKQQQDKNFAFKLVSLTGMAAFNVNCETIHSAFHINPDAKTQKVKMDSVIQAEKVKLRLIDKISTCGLVMLSYINKFLQLTHPGNDDKPFDGISICFFGDPYQIRGIGDYSPWQPLCIFLREQYGGIQDYYFSIPYCFFLMFHSISRMKPDDDLSSWFFGFLNRGRNLELTLDDIDKIRARIACNLSAEEVEQYEDCVHIISLKLLSSREIGETLKVLMTHCGII